MTIKIRLPNQEDDYLTFQIYGPDTVDGTVRIAVIETTVNQYPTPDDWLASNGTQAQALIDASDITNAFTVRQEAKNFIADNPIVLNILNLGPVDFEDGIANRNAQQETLLLQFYGYVARVYNAESQET